MTPLTRLTRLALSCALPLGAIACQSALPVEVTATSTARHRVLFIGNSLTYTNDLPGMLVVIAEMGGDTIYAESVTRPGYALVDHYTAPTTTEALDRIRGARWEYVVLQQGPTSRAIDRDTLVLAAERFDGPIRASGGRPALYMVWPALVDSANFDRVRISFRTAACRVNGDFWPVGEAWRAAWRVDPALSFYGTDLFHPSALGTYLAALVMYERITGHDARSLPARATVRGLPTNTSAATIRALQNAAHAANTAFPEACGE